MLSASSTHEKKQVIIMVHDDIQVDEAKRTNKKRNVDGRMSHFIHKNEYLLLFVVDGLVFLAR